MGIFDIEKLESLEIIPEKKVFQINGQDFAKRCRRFEIYISRDSAHDYCVSIDATGSKTYTFDGKTGEKKSVIVNKNGRGLLKKRKNLKQFLKQFFKLAF